MKRSIKAAGFCELADGRWFHHESGAYGRYFPRLGEFAICRSVPRKRNGRSATNRKSLKPLEEVWRVTGGAGAAKLIRELVTDAMPVGSDAVCPSLLEKMSDRLRCAGTNHAGRNRARGGIKRSRPAFKLVAGWSPKSFRADSRRMMLDDILGR